MAGDEPQGERAFKVEDRRRFSETGDARTDVSGDEQRPEQEPAAAREGKGEPPPEAGAPPAEITFASFILGLSTQALALLGEIQHPEQGGRQFSRLHG